jgi:hypothetical protein
MLVMDAEVHGQIDGQTEKRIVIEVQPPECNSFSEAAAGLPPQSPVEPWVISLDQLISRDALFTENLMDGS